MTEAEIVTAIRRDHLRANISNYKARRGCRLHWERAWVDRGDSIFGPGPYVKLPITVRENGVVDEVTIRVYPPARLRNRLRKKTP